MGEISPKKSPFNEMILCVSGEKGEFMIHQAGRQSQHCGEMQKVLSPLLKTVTQRGVRYAKQLLIHDPLPMMELQLITI